MSSKKEWLENAPTRYSQDDGIGKHSTPILLQPHQNYS